MHLIKQKDIVLVLLQDELPSNPLIKELIDDEFDHHKIDAISTSVLSQNDCFIAKITDDIYVAYNNKNYVVFSNQLIDLMEYVVRLEKGCISVTINDSTYVTLTEEGADYYNTRHPKLFPSESGRPEHFLLYELMEAFERKFYPVFVNNKITFDIRPLFMRDGLLQYKAEIEGELR